MRREIEYQMFVKQPVEHVMRQVERDAAGFGIRSGELDRAVFEWVMERQSAGTVQEWIKNEKN